MSRSSILSVLLVVGIVVVVTKTYALWQEGPWTIPQAAQPEKKEAPVVGAEPQKRPLPIQVAMSTKTITDNNLFDPERGTGKKKENEALARAMQKIRSLVLIGTAIIGENRYAILQDDSSSASPNAKSQKAMPTSLRLNLGDTFESFKLSQIEEKKVAFTNGSTNVEIGLDFFRRVDGARSAVGASRAISPTVSPFPRRDSLPLPPRSR